MKVLVTGGTGLIGSHLGAALLRAKKEVVFLVRPSKTHEGKQRLRAVFESVFGKDDLRNLEERSEVFEGDITETKLGLNPRIIKTLMNDVDEIWHCAAHSSFDSRKQKSIRDINVLGTRNTLALASQINAHRFHHISSAYVCGSLTGTFYEKGYGRPDVEPFKNAYEESKWLAEQFVDQWARATGCPTQIYRLSVVVGDSRTGASNRFVGYYTAARILCEIRDKLIRKLNKAGSRYAKSGIKQFDSCVDVPIRIPCASNATINLITVDYAIRKMLRIAESIAPSGQIFHIVNSNPPLARHLFAHGLAIIGLQISGFVENESALRKNPNTNDTLRDIEEELLRKFGPYLKYLVGEPFFDTTNSSVYADLDSDSAQTFDMALLTRLLAYAQKVDWGRNCIPDVSRTAKRRP